MLKVKIFFKVLLLTHLSN